MSRRSELPSTSPRPAELVTAEGAAAAVGLSLAAFWRAVAAKRLPSPVYPSPRAPRWYVAELHAALEETRSTPREAMTARHAAKLAASRAA